MLVLQVWGRVKFFKIKFFGTKQHRVGAAERTGQDPSQAWAAGNLARGFLSLKGQTQGRWGKTEEHWVPSVKMRERDYWRDTGLQPSRP